MKELQLNDYGMEELSVSEMEKIDGGKGKVSILWGLILVEWD